MTTSPGGRYPINLYLYLKPLRPSLRDGALAYIKADTAEEARGTGVACELVGRARPPYMARAKGNSHRKQSFTLDLAWGSIDRDLWPLASWNISRNETGQSLATLVRARGTVSAGTSSRRTL